MDEGRRAPARGGPLGALGGLIGTATIAAVIVGTLVIGRPAASPDAAATQAPPLAVASTTTAGVGSSPVAAGTSTQGAGTTEPTAASPTAAPPTAAPTLEPETTPAPRLKPTPRPTPKPTPKPVADPNPEPPYRTYTARGAYGATIGLQGMTVRLVPVDPGIFPLRCTTDDPERQGWSQSVSFELTMTWKDPSDADHPELIAGKAGYGVVAFSENAIRSGVPVIVTTCKRPADPDMAVVAFAYRDSLDQYRWVIS